MQTLTFLGNSRASLDVERSVRNFLQFQGLHDVAGLERELDVLLVGKHEQRHFFKRIFAEKRSQLFGCFLNAHFI
jgi:hypothetical protein